MPKAYTIVEYEVLNAASQAEHVPKLQAALAKAGGRSLVNPGGKVTSVDGAAPTTANIIEWESLAQAVAFRESAAFKELAPLREKSIRITRRYIVESGN